MFHSPEREAVFFPEKALPGLCILSVSLSSTHSLALDLGSTVYGAGRTENCPLGSSDKIAKYGDTDPSTKTYKLLTSDLDSRVSDARAGSDFSVFLTSRI